MSLMRPNFPKMSSRRSEHRIYVGRVSRRTSLRDLEHVFGKFGRIRDIDVKHDYAFIEYDDVRDCEDAISQMNGRTLDGQRLKVEMSGRGGERHRSS